MVVFDGGHDLVNTFRQLLKMAFTYHFTIVSYSES